MLSSHRGAPGWFRQVEPRKPRCRYTSPRRGDEKQVDRRWVQRWHSPDGSANQTNVVMGVASVMHDLDPTWCAKVTAR